MRPRRSEARFIFSVPPCHEQRIVVKWLYEQDLIVVMTPWFDPHVIDINKHPHADARTARRLALNALRIRLLDVKHKQEGAA